MREHNIFFFAYGKNHLTKSCRLSDTTILEDEKEDWVTANNSRSGVPFTTIVQVAQSSHRRQAKVTTFMVSSIDCLFVLLCCARCIVIHVSIQNEEKVVGW